MPESQPHATRTSTSAADRLPERWADFTKAVAIYPDTNFRVQQALDALWETLQAALTAASSPETGVPVLFFKDAVQVGEAVRELAPGSNLAWLQERVERAALAGVRFTAGATREGILAFTRRLLAAYQRRDREAVFEGLWPDTYPGLELVDRRLEGVAAPDADGSARARTWGTAVEGDSEVTGVDMLSVTLGADPDVRARLETLRARLDAVRGRGGTRDVNVLGRIVKLMPTDAVEDFAGAKRLALRTLDAIEEQVQSASGSQGALEQATDEHTLQHLVFLLGRNVFGHEGPAGQRLSDRILGPSGDEAEGDLHRTRGHAGDEAFADDVDAFLEEFGRLPVAAPGSFAALPLEVAAEEAGVYLHFLVRLEHDREAARIHRTLKGIFEGADPTTLGVLRQYLRAGWHRADVSAQDLRYDRILDFLRASGLTSLVRECGIVSAESVLETFPKDLVLYLDTLDASKRADQEELAALCGRLGATRILAAADELARPEALLDAHRLALLFGTGSPALLPFARLVLARGGDDTVGPVARYLQGLALDPEASGPLRLAEDPARLPRSYLLGLVTPPADDAQAASFRREVSSLLCQVVREGRGQVARTGRRLEAVHRLARYESDLAHRTLTDVLRARRWLVLPLEPSVLRRAAREVLQHYRRPGT